VAERRRYMVDEEEFDLGGTESEDMDLYEMEDEEVENEAVENEEAEEIVYPAEKTFDCDVNSSEPVSISSNGEESWKFILKVHAVHYLVL
jgi:hypothetical protein